MSSGIQINSYSLNWTHKNRIQLQEKRVTITRGMLAANRYQCVQWWVEGTGQKHGKKLNCFVKSSTLLNRLCSSISLYWNYLNDPACLSQPCVLVYRNAPKTLSSRLLIKKPSERVLIYYFWTCESRAVTNSE